MQSAQRCERRCSRVYGVARLPVRGTQKGTQTPRQITYVEGTRRTRINLEINRMNTKKDLCPCLAGKGSGVRIPDAPPQFAELKISSRCQ
jgi:hypothetical protein